jgi:hypothetical protein
MERYNGFIKILCKGNNRIAMENLRIKSKALFDDTEIMKLGKQLKERN